MTPLRFKPSNIVWINCPALVTTGGPEALHQLGYALGIQGIDARIVYYPERKEGYETPEPYQVYGLKTAPFTLDRPGDTVVVPEIKTTNLNKIKFAQKIIWWLSVDNYNNQKKILERISRIYRGTRMVPQREIRHYCNIAQSEFAKEFVLKQNVTSVPIVSDYLSDVVFSKAITPRGIERQNIVVYNPAKGLDITRRIMKHSDEQILWIPLQGMPPAQVVELFHGAKLYIDFGNHPGRDRLPREAALSGCCILVGENGSAANSDDMPIPKKYKIPKNEIGTTR